jgi:hypothetical protein
MTIKELKDVLNGLSAGYDDHEVLLEGPNDLIKSVSSSLQYTYFVNKNEEIELVGGQQYTRCFIIEGD